MNRYSLTERIVDGERVLSLQDHELGLAAELIPGVGANCHRLSWSRDGQSIELLRPAPSIAALREGAIRYGIPLLFPFPNRIANGRFTFGGQQYTLPITEPERGHAIHGLVLDKPWQVLESGCDTGGAWVACSFSSEDHPAVSTAFPFPFTAEYEVRMASGVLTTRFRARNTGTAPMPMGFGVHPWFPAPLTAGGDRAKCRVQAPFAKVWELERLIPTGRILEPEPGRDLDRGIELGQLEFDDVYTGATQEGSWEATYTDPAAGIEIAVRAEAAMRECVIYTTTEEPIVCLEPYSCTTNAFNLEAQGISAGMVVLSPGDVWATEIQYIPRALSG